MKYLTSSRFGRTRSTSDKNQPSVELSLVTTSSPSLGISPLTCRDGNKTTSVTTGYVQAVEILGWDNEGDVAIERLSLVLQFKTAPARDRYGCRTMKVREVFCLSPFERDFLLRWGFIEIDPHSNLKLAIVEWAISLIELFAGHSTVPLRMSLSDRCHTSGELKHLLGEGLVPRLRGGTIFRIFLEELELRDSHSCFGDGSGS